MINMTFREQLKIFFVDPTFLACIFSWFSAQFIKTLINLISNKIRTPGELVELMIWRTGGMPSSHSALVTALCTTMACKHGIFSDTFMISFVFLMVVIRDAFGVRRSSGIQAKKINDIGQELKQKEILPDYKTIKEVNGHTPMQVILGCVLGFLVGLAFCLLK